jgi:hypothetical protein
MIKMALEEQDIIEAIVSMQNNAARIQNALYKEGKMYKDALMRIVDYTANGKFADGYCAVKQIASEALSKGEFIAEIQ